jgi:predicted transposase YbfD/YdcC
MVGIWDAETRLSLAARADADGNEVAATLAALKTVSLKGCVVTGDALHCHPAMARQVQAQGGHYLLKLKANHRPLLAAAQAAFTAAEAQGTLRWSATEDEANDRIEQRCGCVFSVPATAPAFPGLVAFGRIDSARTTRGGKTQSKTQYVVMSQCLPAWRMLSITRRHWSVENDQACYLSSVSSRGQRDCAGRQRRDGRRVGMHELIGPRSGRNRPAPKPTPAHPAVDG